MNLNKVRILFAAQYSAPYAGNFKAMLTSLEAHMARKYDAICAYVLPQSARDTSWFADFCSNRTVYTVPDNIGSTTAQCAEIVREFKPDIVHTHFDGFDLPMWHAAHKADHKCRVVWHMRDSLSFQRNPLKRLYQYFCFFRHYGRPLIPNVLCPEKKKPSIIAVCKHELDFIRPYRLGAKAQESVVPNSVSLDRMGEAATQKPGAFTFFGIGRRNVQKRADLMMKAGAILAKKGYKFRLKIVGTDETRAIAKGLFGKEQPAWLQIIPSTEDITSLFNSAHCFLNTSDWETFCNAVAEASYMLLPVIQTDIAGTTWNASNPSTFLFDKGDVKGLAAQMERVIKADPAELAAKCAQTRDANMKYLSMSRWCEDIERCFAKL